ncbi:uncharacterized protein LOC128723873 [Anopheles nili]|uniref:uncharacterized protein LOC128723873 n=1 Tax=Anopheles nili TaxID=185578 RepID=UPI00237BD3B2|nr:uncharacterized protein LOC128723873 [Anopheles nili]
MLRVWFLVALVVGSLQGLEVVFEKIEQLSGFDIYDSTLRVRKYNRTTTTLNGTFTLLTPVDNSYIVSTDLYHSSRGNQQFNHYPMKLPTKRLCDFLEGIYDEYYEYIADIVNLPEKGECPIMPRAGHILNKVFPTKAVPKFAPKGLWKVFVIQALEDVEVSRFELILKVHNDLF